MSGDLLREYSPVDLDRHQVEDLVVHCSDNRFQHAFEVVMDNHDIERADKIVFPAPSKNIANGVLVPPIQTLHRLHDFSTIHVYDHSHCGGMAEDYQGEDDEKRMAAIHQRKQLLAISALQMVLPEITVITYVVGAEEVIGCTDSRELINAQNS